MSFQFLPDIFISLLFNDLVLFCSSLVFYLLNTPSYFFCDLFLSLHQYFFILQLRQLYLNLLVCTFYSLERLPVPLEHVLPLVFVSLPLL